MPALWGEGGGNCGTGVRASILKPTPFIYLDFEKNISNFDEVDVAPAPEKINLTITPKPHAHPHTMKKTHAKFHNNWYKTVRGVALTRGTNCLYIKGEK